MKSPQGIRKINENVLKKYNTLIVTDKDKKNYNYQDLSYGTLFLNTKDGIEFVKKKSAPFFACNKNCFLYKNLSVETDWNPCYIKQDGTELIAQPTPILNICYKILEIKPEDKEFIYQVFSPRKKLVSKKITGKITPQNFFTFSIIPPETEEIDQNGHPYILSLKNYELMPHRNHLIVVIDNVLQRTTASGMLIENEDRTTFSLKDNLQVGQFISYAVQLQNRVYSNNLDCHDNDLYHARYVQDTEPVLDYNAELKNTLWIDTSVDIDDNGYMYKKNMQRKRIEVDWKDIQHKPDTLAGYGITDAVKKDAKYTISDILDFPNVPDKIEIPENLPANGEDVDSVRGAVPGIEANNLLKLNDKGLLPKKILDSVLEYLKAVQMKTLIYPFAKGMVINWYGTKDNIPEGWHICDGTEGTPDLRDRFVIGAGNKYKILDSGGSFSHTFTPDEIPAHKHETKKVFWQTQENKLEHPADDFRTFLNEITEANTYLSTTSTETGVEYVKDFSILNPYIALIKIMKM